MSPRKNTFSRMAKMKRERNGNQTSSSEPTSTAKDDFITFIFGHPWSRRGVSSDNATARPQLQISYPYNFSHFTHAERQDRPSLEQRNYTELGTEFFTICAGRRPTSTGNLKDTDADRPLSGESDTLGRFNMFPAQTALNQVSRFDALVDKGGQAGWEDDIDYCYEHGAEATCDHEWDRPLDQTSIKSQ